MTRPLLSISIHLYGAAAVVYLTYLIRQFELLPTVGRLLIGVGLSVHLTSTAMALLSQGGIPAGISQGFSIIALVLLAIFFFLDLRYRMPVVGAFLLPVALAALVPGILLSEDAATLLPTAPRPLLPVHISVALAGIAAFTAAAGVGGIYLLMERQVKGKKFGMLFSRLPSLGLLDDINRRLVVWGFIALSATLMSGAFFASDAHGVFWAWEAKEIATLVAWVVFAAILNARLFAGWQGRRVALLTMAGFCILLVSFFASYDPARATGVFP